MIDPNEKIKLVELTKYNPEWANIFTVAANEIKSIRAANKICGEEKPQLTVLRLERKVTAPEKVTQGILIIG